MTYIPAAAVAVSTGNIADGAVTLAKMANLATARFIGRTTAGTGAPEALTGTQATALLDTFTSGAKGLVAASGGGTTNFLRADGTWTAPTASAAWGGITGTLSSQTDLQAALDAKAALAGATYTGQVLFAANSSSLTPRKMQAGTLDSTIEAGGEEYDGNGFFSVIDTVAGRGFSQVSQFFMLAADAGAAIGPSIADFFGSNSSINLKAASIYMIEYELWFLKTTAGTVTFTLTNTQAPVNMNAGWEGSVTGIGASGTMTRAGLRASTSAAAAMPATPSIADASNVFYRVRVLVETHATVDGNLRLRATSSAGTITPRRGSWYRVTRIPSTSVGSFAA